MADIISYRSLAHTGGIGSSKSSLAEFAKGLLNKGRAALPVVRNHAVAAGHAVRQGGEAVVAAGLVAVTEGYVAPKLPASLQKAPPAAVIGGLGLVGSILLAGHEVSTDARNVGAAAAAIYAADQFRAFLKSKGAPGIHGDPDSNYAWPQTNANYPGMSDDIGGEDPIVSKAQALLSSR
jgi:hypothetical protein